MTPVDLADLVAEAPRDRRVTDRERRLWLAIRQALIIAANAIGEYVGAEPVVVDRAGRSRGDS